MKFPSEGIAQATEQNVSASDFFGQLVVARGSKLHEPQVLRGESRYHCDAVGHEQRELPAMPNEGQIPLDKKLKEVPVAGALVFVLSAEEFFVALVVLLVFFPTADEFLVRLEFFAEPLLEGGTVHTHFSE